MLVRILFWMAAGLLGVFLIVIAVGSCFAGGFCPGEPPPTAGAWALGSLTLFFEGLYVAALRFWPVTLTLLGIFGLQLWIKLQDKRNPPVPPPGGEQAPPFPAPPPPPRSGWAVTSLVLGSCGVLLIAFLSAGFFCAILAILCGHLSLYRIKKASGAIGGRGLAVAGLFMGYAALAVTALALVLLPWHTSGQHKPELEALGRGHQIFISLTTFGGWPFDDALFWPKSGVVPNSTAFFTNVVGHGAINVDYSFFAAEGIKPYRGTNADLFKSENNEWCVVADLHDETPEKIPYLFTRNLRVASLAELKGRVGDQLSGEPPFGLRCVLVIFKGGKARILRHDMLWSNILGGATFTNRVLRP
jgi:hypothetical protein